MQQDTVYNRWLCFLKRKLRLKLSVHLFPLYIDILQCFRHFISVTEPITEDPILLIFDGYYSHMRNLEVIKSGRENNISILCLCPHISHKMQPLYLAFMTPQETYYLQKIESCVLNNFPCIITIC